MKKLIILAVALTLFAASCNRTSVLSQDQVLQIKQFKLSVQLADTPDERTQGLSGISGISDDEGMLFLFSEPQMPQFWMKDMNFPIDIIWISGNKIVGITDSVKPQPNVPESQLIKYSPTQNVDKVLEVNSGWAFRHDVNTGDTYSVVSP